MRLVKVIATQMSTTTLDATMMHLDGFEMNFYELQSGGGWRSPSDVHPFSKYYERGYKMFISGFGNKPYMEVYRVNMFN